MKKLMYLFVIWVLSFTAIQAQTWEKDYEFLNENEKMFIGCESKSGYIFFVEKGKTSYLLKVKKESGDTIWVKENIFSGFIDFTSMKEMDNGKLFITGAIGLPDTPWQNLIVITDSLGNILKKKMWFQDDASWSGLITCVKNKDNSFTVLQVSDNGYALIKFNENLETIWKKEYYKEGYRLSIMIKFEQGYLIVGDFTYQEGNIRSFTVNFDQDGNIIWEKNYTNISIVPVNITEVNDGFLVSGRFLTDSAMKYPAIFKINKQGSFVWKNNYLLGNSMGHCLNTWEIDNKYISVVRKYEFHIENRKTHIVFLDTSGKIINSQNLEKKYAIASTLTSDKHILITGLDLDVYPWALKINPILVQIQNPIIHNFCLKQNYPNPFNAETFIPFTVNKNSYVELIVYNSKGRKVENWSRYCSKGSYEVKFNSENLTSGIYFYKIKMENRTQTKKMLLIK